MTARERLQNRRRCETVDLDHAGLVFTLCAGFYPDGRLAEIFLSSHKPGSAVEAVGRDAAIVTGRAEAALIAIADMVRNGGSP
jgi:hypothetical protein